MMRRHLLLAACVFAALFFAPERHSRALSCPTVVVSMQLGDLLALERVDGSPITAPEVLETPLTACFRRNEINGDLVLGGQCDMAFFYSPSHVAWTIAP